MIDPPDRVFWASVALLPQGPARGVRLEIAAGRLVGVTPGSDPGGADRLPGVVLPGLADNHGHAFHRALRGRTHAGGGSFWTWRERMYEVAARLEPVSYRDLARLVYAEAALAGFTTVAEFHYLHHRPDGSPYDDPNAMGHALLAAAQDAGVRITLLDTCYLTADVDGSPLTGVQRRFGDRDAEHWAQRFRDLCASTALGHARIGAAIHSVRAVPRDALPAVRAAASGLPLHLHLSEQPAENAACLAAHGMTPTALLHDADVLGPDTTAVHATHLTAEDVAILGARGVRVCVCPTTERDLADGIGPARALFDAGARITLGTDQHAIVDGFEEARGLELDERLRSGERGRFTPAQLLAALTDHGGLGWPDAGTIAVGARADLVAVRDDTVRTAGAAPEQLIFAAGAADVDTVVVDGEVVVAGGRHRLGDVGSSLADLLRAVGG